MLRKELILPREPVGAAIFLAGDASVRVTGHTVLVDDGSTVRVIAAVDPLSISFVLRTRISRCSIEGRPPRSSRVSGFERDLPAPGLRL